MYLVTGATGNVGRAVIDLLADEAVAVTRTPAAANLPAARVVTPDALPLDDVEAILLAPRAVGSGLSKLLATAAEHGVERVVLLSAITVEYGGGYQRFADAFKAAERMVRESGLHWCFLRCADFTTNNLAWAPQIRATATVRGAYGDAATAAIHERDIAEIAVKALRDTSHAGESYALTGPESLTQREKARLIGEAIGRPVAFEEISPEKVREFMLGQGLPADVPDRMLGYQAACLEQPGPVTDTVPRLLGRARTFAEWAADHAEAFA